MTFQSFSYKTKTFYIDLIGVMKSVSMSVQSVIAKPVDWIEIFGDLLNEIDGEKPIYFLKSELNGFIWEGGTLDQNKNGLPKHSHTRTTQLTQ